jgi:hypothetical protein
LMVCLDVEIYCEAVTSEMNIKQKTDRARRQ